MSVTKKNISVRLIAFYLPQYHPIPENDEWWGKGFTEWITVAQARPLYWGHYQPHIPADLGFYDLRLPEARNAQAELARQHGIEGFCYWHYWLGNGKQLLERPFEEVLISGEPDFPFCLAWANHSWKGVWFFGAKNRTLIEQTYPGIEDHRVHFAWLLRAFKDRRYIVVEGKPLLYIYKPLEIPDLHRITDLWRELAHQAGLKGLHLVAEGLPLDQLDKYGFDATSYSYHRSVEDVWPDNAYLRLLIKSIRRVLRQPAVYSYRRAMSFFLHHGPAYMNEYPSIVPNWDSTPRLGSEGVVLHNSSPELFRIHVRQAIDKVMHKPFDRRVLFIKSWNEWAEGNYLEPDLKYGKAYLEALLDEIMRK